MTQRNLHDYNADQSIDLNLQQHEILALHIALADYLAQSGLKLRHQALVAGAEPIAESLNGMVLALARRLDLARHGGKNWNAGR